MSLQQVIPAALKSADKLWRPLQVKAVNTTQQLRKPQWFEKFNWFVTSENHLVLSGRDAQQNELLVKRYLRKDDLYVHADLHGAATTIIRNNDPMKAGRPETGAHCSDLYSEAVLIQREYMKGASFCGWECALRCKDIFGSYSRETCIC